MKIVWVLASVLVVSTGNISAKENVEVAVKAQDKSTSTTQLAQHKPAISSPVSSASQLKQAKRKKKKKKKPVFLEPGVLATTIVVDGKPFAVGRNQDRKNLMPKIYQKTGRGIIKPMHPFKPHPVETIGELEMIGYMKRISAGDKSTIVVDARAPIWLNLTGTLPGAVHVSYKQFLDKKEALDILQDEFGVRLRPNGTLDFSRAKTLAIYCNGNWCKMSPTLIRELLKYNYPAEKIKYYRGGMQAWTLLGLPTVN